MRLFIFENIMYILIVATVFLLYNNSISNSIYIINYVVSMITSYGLLYILKIDLSKIFEEVIS